MAIGNVELMHECCFKHLRMGTEIMKQDQETDEGGKKRGMSMERSKAGTKERSPDCLSIPNQNTILMNIISIILEDMENEQRNLINKKQDELKQSKNHLPSPHMAMENAELLHEHFLTLALGNCKNKRIQAEKSEYVKKVKWARNKKKSRMSSYRLTVHHSAAIPLST